jgi:alkanesulfonate monooxygenase SsuD/methylene tetrahydromethanopterin reductase-like flavin-dependent oxidoreductase (luciferase family)
MTPRFCVYQYQHLPIAELRRRWRQAEDLGFDVLWNVDTVVDPDRPRSMMFDGPATLVAMAETTDHIRIGTLVTSLYFREPVLVARAAATVDHISGGRLELALGVGDPSAGPDAAGVSNPAPAERVSRFHEYATLVDRLLRSPVTTFDGQFYRCRDAEVIPGPVQRPRPPLTIAAHRPRMLAIAAELADRWSSWGGYDIASEADFYERTRQRTIDFDRLCRERGRDPSAIRHSLVCFPPLTPWESVDYFEEMVGKFEALGIDEFVLYWPGRWRDAPSEDHIFEAVASDVLPRLRAS